MRYLKFRIQNFKGISDTSLELPERAGPKIITLVGLNESGKTTLLEAINIFDFTNENRIIINSGKTTTFSPNDIVPKDRISNFTGDVQITATVSIDDGDVTDLIEYCRSELSIAIDKSSINQRFDISRVYKFDSSTHVDTETIWGFAPRGRKHGRRKDHDIEGDDWQKITSFLQDRLPIISYFPTFLFDFPQKISLSHSQDAKNEFYRQIFQDILDAEGSGMDISKHIVDRVHAEKSPNIWAEWNSWFYGSRDSTRAQIEQVFFKASSIATKIIFDSWNEVFGQKTSGRSIIIEWNPESANENKRDVSIQFYIKDGDTKYSVSDRSLGFRWFFSFLLFTQVRAMRRSKRKMIFLFDEPASNLHSRAQEQLLLSFPKIALEDNFLIYSTHSHYMINPSWLDQAYIIENAAVRYDSISVSGAETPPSTDISAIKYKRFVGDETGQSYYFQPILDRLQYAPPKIDFSRGGLIVEGKSDYYILRTFCNFASISDFDVIPSVGANEMAPLISLFLGWGRSFHVLLDGDAAGKAAKEKYVSSFAISETVVTTLDEYELPGGPFTKIEKAISKEMLISIGKHFASPSAATKKQTSAYFQEYLAAGNRPCFDDTTINRLNALLSKIKL